MFTVEYVESADPLIELVQTDPGKVFRKPHTAYLLFLFSEADAQTAEWIRRNLRALDSLLGPDIAGAVFVKRFQVRALVRSCYTRGQPHRTVHGGTVDLSEIGRIEETAMATPMFTTCGERSTEAHRSIEDLTATTYASDEIARSLGVVGDLPCIAFLDATPGPIRCLRLDADTLPNALTLIRRIVGGLTAAAGYEKLRRLLAAAHVAGEEIGRLRKASEDSALVERETLNKLKDPLEHQLRVAHAYLVEGSARKFRYQLRHTSLPKEQVEAAMERASTMASVLTHVCKTIRGVSWYADAEWPISKGDLERLARILSDHAVKILDTGVLPRDGLNETVVRDVLAALGHEREKTIANIWGDLPQPQDLQREFASASDRVTSLARKERNRLASEAKLVSSELEQSLRELALAPRITYVFDTMAGQRHGVTKEVDLGPEMIERLLNAVTAGAIRIVGRDLYIGTNVGAMGPFAKADGTTFGGGIKGSEREHPVD